jgi:excisionase family DNA binding protein
MLPAMNADRNFLTITQLADELGVSRSYIDKTRRQGVDHPSYIRIGRRVVYRRQTVEAWLKTKEVQL